MKIVDDSGSDVEDLIHTAEKTEGKTSVVKDTPVPVELKPESLPLERSEIDEPMPSGSKNESEPKSSEDKVELKTLKTKPVPAPK